MTNNKKICIEVSIVTAIVIGVTSTMQSAYQAGILNSDLFSLIFAVIFLYVPIVVLKKRKRDIDFLDKNAGAVLRSLAIFAAAAVIIFPLFFIGAHFWVSYVYGQAFGGFSVPPDIIKTGAYQLLMIALPEEFYFRGYVQSSLNNVFSKKWRILGADLGWSWVITAAAFAIVHSFVALQWWHFAIFFPGLLFGYLRELTGSITAPILIHAMSNIVMAIVIHIYF